MMTKCCIFLVFFIFFLFVIQSNSILYEGDNCELAYKEPGVCVRLSQCPSAIEIVKRRQHPKNCGFIRSIPIVCCPKSQTLASRLAEQKCKQYNGIPEDSFSILSDAKLYTSPPIVPTLKIPQNKENNNVHQNTFDLLPTQPTIPDQNPTQSISTKNDQNLTDMHLNITSTKPPELLHSPSMNRIKMRAALEDIFSEFSEEQTTEDLSKPAELFVVGGEDAKIREFPHMAALGYINKKEILWLCGGSLISDEYVLTAAHCLTSKEFGNIEWVRLGDLDLVSTVDQTIPQDYRVKQTITHPAYKAPSVYHDIALIQLDRVVVFTKFVKPACLFINDKISMETEVIATGWGLTQPAGSKSDILQKVDLNLFTEKECNDTYENLASSRRLNQGIIHEQQFCAGSRTIEKDTCQGDSGGPLQIRINDGYGDIFYIVGITSFGKSCGLVNVPAVYIKVSYYVPWIENVIWPSDW